MDQINLQAFLDDAAALPRNTTLLRENGLRSILLHLKPGEQIPEHQTRGAITVHCLKGQATFVAGSDRVELTPFSLIIVAPAAPHSVVAQQETLLLVTISEQVPAPSAAQ